MVAPPGSQPRIVPNEEGTPWGPYPVRGSGLAAAPAAPAERGQRCHLRQGHHGWHSHTHGCPRPHFRVSLSPELSPLPILRLSLSPLSRSGGVAGAVAVPTLPPGPVAVPDPEGVAGAVAVPSHLCPQQEPEAAVTPPGRGHVQRWQLRGTAGGDIGTRGDPRARPPRGDTAGDTAGDIAGDIAGDTAWPRQGPRVGVPSRGSRVVTHGSGAKPGTGVPSAALVPPRVALCPHHGPSVPQC